MEQKIEVLVDIYPNRFSQPEQYAYANIRSVNPDEQTVVDDCIQKMLNAGNDLLIGNMIISGNRPFLPIEQDKQCFLNISKQIFEF